MPTSVTGRSTDSEQSCDDPSPPQRLHADRSDGFRANWYCVDDIDADWELEETGWRVRVEGDAPMDIRIRFPVALEDYPSVMPGLTAHRAVNSVIAVCESVPGIRTTVDLPQVIARF